MTAIELLNWASHCLEERRVENPRLDAELLLSHSLDLSREGLYMHLKDPLPDQAKDRLEKLIQRRVSGEPLQYLLGSRSSGPVRSEWTPGSHTETRDGSAGGAGHHDPLRNPRGRPRCVLEIGTGSGAVAIALLKEVKDIFLVATDISLGALRLAKENAGKRVLGVKSFSSTAISWIHFNGVKGGFLI